MEGGFVQGRGKEETTKQKMAEGNKTQYFLLIKSSGITRGTLWA